MAEYTEGLAWATVLLALTTLGVLIVTWRASVRQSRDMAASIAETRRIGEAQVRAYVNITAATVIFAPFAEGVAPAPIDDVQPFIRITAKNNGQSPARNFVWNPTIQCFGMGPETKTITRELGANWREIRGMGIAASDEHSDGAILPLLLMKFLREKGANQSCIIVRLRIQFEFEDVFDVKIADETYFSGGFIRKPDEAQQTSAATRSFWATFDLLGTSPYLGKTPRRGEVERERRARVRGFGSFRKELRRPNPLTPTLSPPGLRGEGECCARSARRAIPAIHAAPSSALRNSPRRGHHGP